MRELVRVIEQAIKKYDCDKLQPEHLTFSLQEVSETPTTMKLNDESEEKTKIVKALESCGYRREPAKNNDFDCVIMSHDQFGKIPQSPEMQEKILMAELQSVEDNLETLRMSGKNH